MSGDDHKLKLVAAGAVAVGGLLAAGYLASRGSDTEHVAFEQKPRHGGDLVAETLKRHGVEFVFALSGGHISPILVGAKRLGIRVIDVRHEVNAVFAADAVSRLTDTIGVAAVTAGPGVTNTITAVKNAQMAHSPLVLLGGATLGLLKGRGSLQDIDQQTLMAPHVKWQCRVTRVTDIVPMLEKAFHVAGSGVPGPVFVELPLDLLFPEADIRDEFEKKLVGKPGIVNRISLWYTRRYFDGLYGGFDQCRNATPIPIEFNRASPSQVSRVGAAFNAAQKPVLIVGSQVMARYAQLDDVVRAIEKLGAPVWLSSAARGLLGKDHPLQMRHKRGMALKECDLVLLLGVPCDFRLGYGLGFGRNTKVIGVNLDREQLYLNRTPDIAVHACAADLLVRVAASEQQWPARADWTAALRARDDARNAEIAKQAEARLEGVCNPINACAEIEKVLADRSVLVADGGDFIGTAAYTISPRGPLSWMDPGPFGTLGVGAGFALGAKLVRPDYDVVLLYGDGSCGYSVMEYDTFVRHGVNVVSIVGNDACWRQIHRDQVRVFEDDVACVLTYQNYHEVAQALGGEGYRIDKDVNLHKTLTRALAMSRGEEAKPVLVNIMVGKTSFRDGSISV